MRNNKGFARSEVISVFVIIASLFCFAGYLAVQGANQQRVSTMVKSALSFRKVVTNNSSSFHYSDVVYLREVVDENIINNIKNPFEDGYCDVTQSKVDTQNGTSYITLKCGEYLIDKDSCQDVSGVQVFKVTDWSLMKPEGENIESRTLYNCEKDGQEIFDTYLEEHFFIYEYNQMYNTDYYFVENIHGGSCKVISKVFYRSRIGIN